MNMRGPARARSLADGTYWVALKAAVQFVVQKPLPAVSNVAAAAMIALA